MAESRDIKLQVDKAYRRSEIESMGLKFLFTAVDKSDVYGLEKTLYVMRHFRKKLIVTSIYRIKE